MTSRSQRKGEAARILFWGGSVLTLGLLCLFAFGEETRANPGPSPEAAGSLKAASKNGWVQKEVHAFKTYPHLDRAYRLLDARRYLEAKEELEKYLHLASADPEARMAYVMVLFQLKDYPAVVVQSQQVLQSRPDSVPARLYQGLAWQKLDATSQALDSFQAASRVPHISQDKLLFALNMVADLGITSGRYAQAAEALARIQPLAEDFSLYFRRGLVEEKTGNQAAAEKAYRQALSMAQNPDEKTRGLGALAELYKNQAQPEKAQQLFTEALSLKPEDLGLLRNLADLAYQQKNYDQALRWAREIAERQPTLENRRRLATLLNDSGQLEEALVEYQRLLPDLDSKEARSEILMARGYAYVRLKKFSLAAEEFSAAVKLNGNPEARAAYAQAIASQRTWGDQPADPRTQVSSAEQEYQLGLTNQKQGFLKDAKSHFEAAVAAHPQNILYAKQLGYACANEKEYREAVDIFKGIVKQSPDDLESHTQLGYLYMKMARNKEAIQSFERAVACLETEASGTLGGKNRDAREIAQLQQEIQRLSSHLEMTLYQIYRSNLGDKGNAPGGFGSGGSILSQGGVEVSYQPPVIGFRDERIFQLTSRLLWNTQKDSLSIENDSYQAGLGFRYKPLRLHNFFIGAERLLKIGSQAQDNWLLRNAYSWGVGTELKTDVPSWNYTSLYADTGYFLKDPRWAYFTEARQGWSFNYRNRLVVTPHVTVGGRWEDPDPTSLSYTEGGAGVLFTHSLNAGKASRPGLDLGVLVQYRFPFDGSASGFVISGVIRR